MLYNYQGYNIIAGCDEAGRGCLAGPVYAAAVILPKGLIIQDVNDSKQLNPHKRELLRVVIENEALDYAIGYVDNVKIYEINILNASILAMHIAISKLHNIPDFLLIDGNRFKHYNNIPYKCIIKGDATHAQIAAASIIAKTYRDEYMKSIDNEFPQYDWYHNKGYPTQKHVAAILKYGLTKYHRKTFSVPSQIKLF